MSSEVAHKWQELWSRFSQKEFSNTSEEVDTDFSLSFISESELLEKDDIPAPCNNCPKKKEAVLDVEDLLGGGGGSKQKSKEEDKADLMPEKPDYPTPDMCCGDGCRVCVYDRYEWDMEKFEKEMKEWEKRQEEKKTKPAT